LKLAILISTYLYKMITRLLIIAPLFLSSAWWQKGIFAAVSYYFSKALKLYKAGVSAFDYVDYISAERFFKEALDVDDGFFEAYMISESFFKQKRYGERH